MPTLSRDVELDVEELLGLPDADYRDEIDELLRSGERDPDWAVVMSDRLCRRTKAALQTIRSAVVDYDGLDPVYRRALARKMHHAQIAVLVAAQREEHAAAKEARDAVGDLAAAVAEHRAVLLASGFEPEDHDRGLWRALADLTLTFGPDRLTLDEALGAGKWASRAVPDAD